VVDLKELAPHRKRCLKMQEKYGVFFDAFNDQVESISKEGVLEEWKNVRILYEHFRERFIDNVDIER
jgi:hypothetical protein